MSAIATKKKGTVKSMLLPALKHDEPPPPWMGLDGELSGEDAGTSEDDGGDDGFADCDGGEEEEDGKRVDEPVPL